MVLEKIPAVEYFIQTWFLCDRNIKKKGADMHTNKYIMEFIGALFLTLAITLTGNPIAIGFMLAAMIVVGGHISGAHCNPAVSLSMFLRNQLSMNDFLFYAAAQTAGAACAIMLFNVITGAIFAPDMAAELPLWVCLVMEGILTFVFCWVVLTLATRSDRSATMSHMPILVGFTLMTIAFVGGLFNPAVGLAAYIINMVKGGAFVEINHLLIYVVAPLVGGFFATHAYHFLNDNNYSQNNYQK